MYKNPSYKPPIWILEQPEFGCWFGNYLRQACDHCSVSEYAQSIGETDSHVVSVMYGTEEPCQSILDDMKMELIRGESNQYRAIEQDE